MTEKAKTSGEKTGRQERSGPDRSGQATGKPEKGIDLVLRCREMTPEVLDQIATVLREGKEADRLRAAAMILAYGWGKEPQTVDLNHGGEAGSSLFDPEKRQEIIDAALERLRASGAGGGQLRR
ncbi:MAG: hypothetical protein P4N59_25560 [Negativicutes bacterium]|nr:hypothetical protein [Negativicutes bacterium]